MKHTQFIAESDTFYSLESGADELLGDLMVSLPDGRSEDYKGYRVGSNPIEVGRRAVFFAYQRGSTDLTLIHTAPIREVFEPTANLPESA